MQVHDSLSRRKMFSCFFFGNEKWEKKHNTSNHICFHLGWLDGPCSVLVYFDRKCVCKVLCNVLIDLFWSSEVSGRNKSKWNANLRLCWNRPFSFVNLLVFFWRRKNIGKTGRGERGSGTARKKRLTKKRERNSKKLYHHQFERKKVKDQKKNSGTTEECVCLF